MAASAPVPQGLPQGQRQQGRVYPSVMHAFGLTRTPVNVRNNVDPFEPGPAAEVWKVWLAATDPQREVVLVDGFKVHGMVSPAEPGGVPDGWQVLGEPFSVRAESTWHLVHGAADGDFPGCWALLQHLHDMRHVVLERDVADLNDLLIPGAEAVARISKMSEENRRAYEKWLLSTVASLYDRTDPAQAAEQTLLLLAGRVRQEPPQAMTFR